MYVHIRTYKVVWLKVGIVLYSYAITLCCIIINCLYGNETAILGEHDLRVDPSPDSEEV